MEDKNKNTAEKEENEKFGKMSGLAGGAVTGAAIGSTIMPVVGTVAGAIVGGVVGSEIGQKAGKFLDKLSETKTTVNTAKTDISAELEKLSKLHDDGVLDDDEFRAAKAQLLNMK